ncbi:archaellin/type IV pilin N-terminal domain-containing protein [Methanosarcina hadiensis]|uniref:type IV pilin n=1 Tax=Methanosarcina hadiensis TaxID=3078083 RepID=UPI0039777430
MPLKTSSIVKHSDEKGIAPVIGTAVTIVIVFILAGLVSSVFFEEYGNPSHKIPPAAKLQIYFTGDESSLEFKHEGGDQLFFGSPSLSVIMDINGTSYPLNDSALGTLEAGEKGVLALNTSELPELKAGDLVSVKVVDYESGGLIAKHELEV